MASRNTPGTSSAKLTKEERRKQAREAARLLQIEEAKRAKKPDYGYRRRYCCVSARRNRCLFGIGQREEEGTERDLG